MDKLIISNRDDLINYCAKKGISISEFNEPVEISEGAYCVSLFADCKSFNQPIVIPTGVKDCSNMFMGCTSFNQPVIIPSSVENCNSMFRNCTSFNQPVKIAPHYSGIVEEVSDSCSRDVIPSISL